MREDFIRITGARQHNLKNLSVTLPKNSLTVITGVSGSGKSSLAFDTLYAEGQRRYVESLSAHAQQFLERLEKPDVDSIEGLSPAIAIEQHTAAANPRSTIATVTEIYDFLRVLYATCGTPHDPATGEPIHRYTTPEIAETILAMPEGTRLMILSPLPESETMQPKKLFEKLARQGFVRVRVKGEVRDLEEKPEVEEGGAIDLVVDRLVVRPEARTRLMDSLPVALRWSGPASKVIVLVQHGEKWKEQVFTTLYANPVTGFRMPPLTPRHFSFNSHAGACSVCEGLGTQMWGDPDLIVPDKEKSLADGAVKTWWGKNPKLKVVHDRKITALAAHFKVDVKSPFASLPQNFKDALFNGTGKVPVKMDIAKSATTRIVGKPFEGLVNEAQRLATESESEFVKQNVRRYMNPAPCAACGGRRLKPEFLAVTLQVEEKEFAIDEFAGLTIAGARTALRNLTLTAQQRQIVPEVLREMESRLRFLEDVGVGYLTLSREYGSLSGGEAQRIRLATQLGSRLSGVLYVLDEPSIGLHQRDNDRLLATLRELRDLGNTVVVVEHDEDTINAADWVIDIGPGAGPRGGEIIGSGPVSEITANAHSVTGQFLSGAAKISVPKRRMTPPPLPKTKGGDVLDTGWFTVHGATENNLQNVDVSFPVGCLVCVTGVSGSGKSTLVDDILRREISRRLYHAKDTPGKHAGISGLQQFDKAVVIDQSPIGRSPRSNPATYVGAFNHIRELFSQLPAAKVRGYTPGTFSFNTAGGRCETCEGDGVIRIDMHFLSDVYITCEACEGKRYNREVLEVTFKGRNIADVLEMTLDEAADFFRTVPGLGDKLRMMGSVGLGYLKLGQASNTLSGGEAQRIKLSAELSKRATGRTLYLLDEPTTGLHFSDIETLLRVLFGLRDQGNTLIVIEHNLDVIKCADWVIDMGPEGGAAGGRIVAEGPPEAIARCEASLTGRYLRVKLP
ncbi:MAG TPA: excinuclease ABC subunit UvrA [Verrucomicrobiales bacterium]|nr:excinuclease ABC subunit UvrA [Verrucomicrobiales bacterium]